MRTVIVSLLVVGLFSSTGTAGQTGGKPAIKACSLLTKELAMKFSGAAQKAVFDLPPDEQPVGKSGSACDYADIRLQIDPFPWSTLEASAKKNKTSMPVSGVGDAAYFQGDRNYASLMAVSGGHTLTIQMGVPFQSTAEKVRPNVIGLAQAIIPKLK